MPNKCSIVYCGAGIRKNRPNLNFHRLPQNKSRRRIWLEVIGTENLRADLKNVYICSLHFEEKAFNRTMSVLRLRDDAVPSLRLKQPSTVQQSVSTVRDDNTHEASQDSSFELQPSTVHKSVSTVRDDNTHEASQHSSFELDQAIIELIRLQDKVNNQEQKIKCLNETVRRQKIRIQSLKKVVKDLRDNKVLLVLKD